MNRYSNIEQIKNINEHKGTLGKPYYKTNFYPEIPLNENDTYVITNFGDRLDILAEQFYNDPSLYWIISIANPTVINFGSLSIQEGTQLRIPVNLSNIINSYKNLNNI